MQIKNASGPGVLIPDQLRVLNELASSGGVQIIRHHRDQIHYEALEQKRFIGATELSENEIRYNITSSGRTVLAAHP